MKEEMKIKLFEKMLEIEHSAFNQRDNDTHDYVEQSDGAFEMFKILGIDEQYCKWSEGRF